LPVAVELSGWTLSVLICYELRFPELFGLTLGRTNAFVVPAAWPSSRIEHWRTLLVARALENAAYVVGVNRWGPGTHGPFGGNSCVVDPLGARRCMGEGEGLLVVELEKERVEEARRFPALADRLKLRGTLPSAGRRSDRG
jgi:predicted amidohydrolase